MRTTHLLLAGSALAGKTLGTPSVISPDAAAADITTEGLRSTLEEFYNIAKKNGGNRAFGLPGYKASVDYVLHRASKPYVTPAFTSWTQSFNHTFEATLEIAVTGPEGEDVFVKTLVYNPATPLPGGITAELIDTPVDDPRGSGCFEDQWTGIDATGKIALVKRGVCAVSDKLKLAKAHGALAVILYNQDPGTSYQIPTLGSGNVGLLIPCGIIPLENGAAWKERLVAGEKLTATLLVDSVFEQRESWNVFAETKEGDPDNIVVLGAHLDGVQEGPGINDDGSGSAALLEVLNSLAKYTGFKNKIRLAWWGAEESGLIGSLFHTRSLTEEQADKIRFYFNYDMIGSIEPVWYIYKDPNESVGAEKLRSWLVTQGKPAEFRNFGSSSDYVGFLNLGIPSSGIFTGAGAPMDPCYHQACDTIDNIHWEAITLNAKAAARAAADFAVSLEGVPARNKTTQNRNGRRNMLRTFQMWEQAAEHAEHEHMCAHKKLNDV